MEYINSETSMFKNSKTFIIGGEMLYKYTLDNYSSMINKIYVTELYISVTCDKFFPTIDKNKFSISKVSNFKKENNMYYRYFVYVNND